MPSRPSRRRLSQAAVAAPEPTVRRPAPPDAALHPTAYTFRPAPDVALWLVETFVAGDGPLVNADHKHLAWARLGVLWTNVPNRRQMREVLATAEMLQLRGSAWQKGRAEHQLAGWFGQPLPDFLITLSAPALAAADDATFCAILEHELFHCAQARDEFGQPRFTDEGRPKYAIRGHDVEEFTPIVRRYGAEAAGVTDFVAAAAARPLMTAQAIAGACGTCLRRVA